MRKLFFVMMFQITYQILSMNSAWCLTARILFEAKFFDIRSQNVPEDRLPDKTGNYSSLPNYKLDCRLNSGNDHIYAYSNDDGYVEKQFTTTYSVTSMLCWIQLKDGNQTSPGDERWRVVDDYGVLYSFIFDSSTADIYIENGIKIFDYHTKYVGDSGTASEKLALAVHATADNFDDVIIQSTSQLRNKWGVNAVNGGTGQATLYVDPTYEDKMDCGLSNYYFTKHKPSCTDNDRIAHELGHLTHRVLNNFSNGNIGYLPSHNYCYPDTEPIPPAVSCSHSITSKEWGVAIFTEAFPNFLATAARWDRYSTEPKYRTYNIEGVESINPVIRMCQGWSESDTTQIYRNELNATRFLWDLYDDDYELSLYNVPQGTSYWIDDEYVQLFTIVNIFGNFYDETSNRINNHGIDETYQYGGAEEKIDQPNMRDVWWHFDDYFGDISRPDLQDWLLQIYYMNCMRRWQGDSSGTYRWQNTGRSP